MKILVLAGTGEARQLIQRLSDDGHDVLASLAGATRQPLALGSQTRIGGFGGDAGFAAFLSEFKPDLVIDATHPFAHRITKRTARICQEQQINHLILLREEWRATSKDKWTFINRPVDCAQVIGQGKRVFLATGRQTLGAFSNLSGCHVFCRQIDPPDQDFPFPNGEFVIGRPPFSRQEEIELFQRLEIDWLVVKNAGGDASRTKLDAARDLGLPVLMLTRPATPDARVEVSVAGVIDYVNSHAHN